VAQRLMGSTDELSAVIASFATATISRVITSLGLNEILDSMEQWKAAMIEKGWS